MARAGKKAGLLAREHRERLRAAKDPDPVRLSEAARALMLLTPSFDEWSRAIRDGFHTDGASVPFFLWWLRRPCGVDIGEPGDLAWPPRPAVRHDYRYWQGGSHEDWHRANLEYRDYLFLTVMRERNPYHYSPEQVAWKCQLHFLGVESWIGKICWRRAALEKMTG